MNLPRIYSRRKKESQSEGMDVFTYEEIPSQLRISLFMVMNRAADKYTSGHGYEIWADVVEVLREDLGAYRLIEGYSENATKEAETYFSHKAPVERVLDTIELWNAFCREKIRSDPYARTDELQRAVGALNARLLEGGIGFELVGGNIVEKANEFAHAEVTLPALKILSGKRFEGANQEFRDAHAAYRSGEYKDCLVDCLKSIESVIKTIALERRWNVDQNANAKTLIGALFENQYIPSYMQSQFTGLRTQLESGVPTTRNKSAGHGQGTRKVEVPKALAAFQLHQTAATIIFLTEVAD